MPAGQEIYGLLHDATEAYLLDLPSPVKNNPAMAFYRQAEVNAHKAIAEAFGLNPVLLNPDTNPVLKKADRAALEYEWQHYVTGYRMCISANKAKYLFLQTFEKYHGKH